MKRPSGFTARDPRMDAGTPSAYLPPTKKVTPSFYEDGGSSAAPKGAASTIQKHLPQKKPASLFQRGGRSQLKSSWETKAGLIRDLLAMKDSPEKESVLKSLMGCGAARIDDKAQGGVLAKRVKGKDGKDASGHISGVYRCNRTLCPVCGPRISVRRTLPLLERSKWVSEAFPDAVHVTGALTCRHREGGDPRVKFDALTGLFNRWGKQRWVQGRLLKGTKSRPVLLGYFMCPEITFGRHGFHPHLQFGFSLQAPEGLGEAGRIAWFQEFQERSRKWFAENAPDFGITTEWGEKWMSMASAPVEAVIWYALKIESAHAPGALSEALAGIGKEVTLGPLKEDLSGASLYDMPRWAYVQLWNATKGMRWFRSGGIWKTRASEATDEQLAAQDESTGAVVAEMAPAAWRKLSHQARHFLAALVEDVRFSSAIVHALWAMAQGLVFQGAERRVIRDTLLSALPAPPGSDPASPPESCSETDQ